MSIVADDAIEIVCDSCGKARKTKRTKNGERLPMGWKRAVGTNAPCCDSCWHNQYDLRAITIPVAGPVGAEWKDLRIALKQSFAAATTLANAAILELATNDIRRNGSMAKLPKMPSIYLYGHPSIKPLVDEMDSQSAAAVLRAVEAKYRAKRFDVIWLRKAALPTYRYPTPYPIHNQSWSASTGPDNELLVSARFGGDRWTLRLRGGAGFARQRKAVLQLIAGKAVAGELALYEQSAGETDHRPNGTEKGKAATRLMCKMVLWLPKRATKERSGVLRVRTAPDRFWIAEIDGREIPWNLNADRIRAKIVGHKERMQRLSEDTKHEKRWPVQAREAIGQDREETCLNQNRRVDEFVHQASAMLAAFADRQNVAQVIYDDSCKSYMPSFPWADLRLKLSYKLDSRSIGCQFANTEVPSKDGEVVAENGKE